jgi:uncharacterized protein GlcG (DUF336 family)
MSLTLTLPLARLLGDLADAAAAAISVPVTVAVVDGEAGLVYLARMDDALPASRDLAVAKAQTAASLRMATDEVGRLAQPGAPLYGIQHVAPGRIVLFGGGLPLQLGGTVVGGIGVSGGTVEEDVQIAGSVVEGLAEMERWSSAPPLQAMETATGRHTSSPRCGRRSRAWTRRCRRASSQFSRARWCWASQRRPAARQRSDRRSDSWKSAQKPSTRS